MSEPIRILTRLTAVSATLGAVSCNYDFHYSSTGVHIPLHVTAISLHNDIHLTKIYLLMDALTMRNKAMYCWSSKWRLI